MRAPGSVRRAHGAEGGPRAGGAVALLVVTTVLAGGCGVPTSSTSTVAPDRVPYGLLEGAPDGVPSDPGSRSGVGTRPGTGADAAEVATVLAARTPGTYLIGADDALVAVPLGRSWRPGVTLPGVAGADDEQSAALVRVLLRRLSGGPSPEQREAGLSTALGRGVPVALVDVVDGTARVALRQPDRDPPADRLSLAAGQVVLTVTSAPGVSRVQLLRDGSPAAVPLPGGARSDAPVTALDYAVLLGAAR